MPDSPPQSPVVAQDDTSPEERLAAWARRRVNSLGGTIDAEAKDGIRLLAPDAARSVLRLRLSEGSAVPVGPSQWLDVAQVSDIARILADFAAERVHWPVVVLGMASLRAYGEHAFRDWAQTRWHSTFDRPLVFDSMRMSSDDALAEAFGHVLRALLQFLPACEDVDPKVKAAVQELPKYVALAEAAVQRDGWSCGWRALTFVRHALTPLEDDVEREDALLRPFSCTGWAACGWTC
eukprot:jgi/Tetstr1/460724/TSEL_005910.t1